MATEQSLTYKVKLDSASARQQAAALRAAMQRELSQIDILPRNTRVEAERAASNLGRGLRFGIEREMRQIDILPDSAVREAEQEAQRIGQRLRQSVQQAGGGGSPANALGGGLNALTGGLAAVGISLGAREIAQQAAALEQLDARANLAKASLLAAAGSADQAAQSIAAVKDAANGTVSSLQATEIAAQAMNLGLAQTPEQIGRLVQAAQAIVAVSPTINDLDTAFAQLSLTVANKSTMRLDQLGLSVEDVGAGFSSLEDTGEALDRVLTALETKYSGLQAAMNANVSSVQQMRASWEDFRVDLAEFVNPAVDAASRALSGIFTQGSILLGGDVDLSALREQADRIADVGKNTAGLTFGFFGENTANDFDLLRDTIDRVVDAMRQGVPLADEMAAKLKTIAQTAVLSEAVSQDDINALHQINSALDETIAQAARAGQTFYDTAAAADTNSAALQLSERAALAAGLGLDNLSFTAQGALLSVNLLTGGVATLNVALAQLDARYGAINRAQSAVQSRIISQARGVSSIVGPAQAEALAREQIQIAEDQLGFLRNIAQTGIPIDDISLQFQEQALIDAATAPFEEIQQAERDRIAAERKIQQASERAGTTTARANRAAANTFDQSVRDFDNAIRKVPGLFDNSPVTAEDLADAKAGRYTEKADEFRRQALDLLLNGVQRDGISKEDIAQRLNVDIATPNDVLAELLNAAWDDSSFFAGGKNLDVLNLDAVRAALDQQKRAVDGEQQIVDYIREQLGITISKYTSGGSVASSGGGGGAPSVAAPGAAGVQVATPSIEIQPLLDEIVAAGPIAVPVTLTLDDPASDAVGKFLGAIGIQIGENIAVIQGHGAVISNIMAQAYIDADRTPYGMASQFIGDLGIQIGTLLEPIRSHGRVVSNVMALAFEEADRTPYSMASKFIGDVGIQIGENLEAIKSQGAAISATMAQGLVDHDRSEYAMVAGFVGSIGIQIGENLETIQGQGGAMAANIATGFKNYQPTDLLGSFIATLRTSATFEPNQIALENVGNLLAESIGVGIERGIGGINIVDIIVSTVLAQVQSQLAEDLS